MAGKKDDDRELNGVEEGKNVNDDDEGVKERKDDEEEVAVEEEEYTKLAKDRLRGESAGVGSTEEEGEDED